MSDDTDNAASQDLSVKTEAVGGDFTAKIAAERTTARSIPNIMRWHYCKQMLAALANPEASVKWVEQTKDTPAHYQLLLTIDDQALIRAYEGDLQTMVSHPEHMAEPRIERGIKDALDTLRHYYGMNEAVIKHTRAHSQPIDIGYAPSMHADISPWLGIALTKQIKSMPGGKGHALDIAVQLPNMHDIETRRLQWQRDLPQLTDAVQHGMLEIIEAADKHTNWTLPTGYGRA